MRLWRIAIPVMAILTTARAADAPLAEFTPAERTWITQHPVVNIAVEPNMAPIEYIENGQYKGLSSEYINAIAQRTGLTFKVVPNAGGTGAIPMLEQRKVDLLPALATQVAPSRFTELVNATSDYYAGATVIVTVDKAPIVFDLAQLHGQTVAVKVGGSYQFYLQNNYRDIHVLALASPEDALNAVLLGDADAAMGADASLLPYLRRKYDGQLHVSGVIPGMPYVLGMGVRSDLPLLRSIVDKSLKSITAKERNELDAKWLERTDYGAPSFSVLIHYYGFEAGLALISLLAITGFALYARRQQRLAERSQREKAMFLAVMTHEIRSPMNAILASVELLQRTDLPPDSRRLSEVASTGAESLLRLLDDVLEVSKLEAGKVQLELSPVDIMEVVRGVTGLLELKAREKAIGLTLTLNSPIAGRLMLDRLRVEQVLYNIVSNAVKFTAKGQVNVSVALHDVPDQSELATLRLDVVDTGTGIDAAQQESLFQPYAQASISTSRKFGGTGLGLVICRNLVALMGGTIKLSSELGRGTSVVIEIPCKIVSSPPNTAGLEHDESAAPIMAHTLNVLVVEDATMNQIVLEAQLKQLGCRSDVVQSGSAALQRQKQRSYDIVLLDCDLPDFSGYEVASQWRAYEAMRGSPPTPILALSGRTDVTHITACFEAGMDTVLHKPIKLAKLHDALLLWSGVDIGELQSETPASSVSTEMVANDLADELNKLRTAYENGNLELALHHAHRLSGAASLTNIHELASESNRVELLLRGAKLFELPALDGHLEELHALLKAWLEDQSSKPQPTHHP